MSNPPDWLPQIISLSGEWKKDLDSLYKQFSESFLYNSCYFRESLIFIDKRIIDEPYEEGFWHLITKDDNQTKERLPDFRRAERLSWCRPLIENCDDAQVKTFDWLHSNKKYRTHIWLEEFDYIVILEKLPNGKAAILITAYFIEGDSTRKKFTERYNNRR